MTDFIKKKNEGNIDFGVFYIIACNAGLHVIKLLDKIYMREILDLSVCYTVNMPVKIKKG